MDGRREGREHSHSSAFHLLRGVDLRHLYGPDSSSDDTFLPRARVLEEGDEIGRVQLNSQDRDGRIQPGVAAIHNGHPISAHQINLPGGDDIELRRSQRGLYAVLVPRRRFQTRARPTVRILPMGSSVGRYRTGDWFLAYQSA